LLSVRAQAIGIAEEEMQTSSKLIIGLHLVAGCLFMVACAKEGGISTTGAGGALATGGHTGASSGGASGTLPGAGGALAGSGGRTTGAGGAVTGTGGVPSGAGGVISGTGGAPSGAGGATICPAIACVLPNCPYGTLPNPSGCGCPICAPPPDAAADVAPDAVAKDGEGPDGIVVCTAACVLPNCPNGTIKGPPPCGCPICAPSDGGAVDVGTSDAPIICQTLVACPAIACLYGYVPSPAPCGCPTCAPPDGGASLDAAGADGPVVCTGIVCPAIACAAGFAPSPTPCGCPVCAGATQ
jgi:hypothetical protein